jgi:hypothetical protein
MIDEIERDVAVLSEKMNKRRWPGVAVFGYGAAARAGTRPKQKQT